MESLISTIFALFFLLGASDALSRTIIVDKNGQGKFTTVQQAIDSIPENNSLWTRILIKHGVYTEKVVIPKEKPYVILEGEANQLTSIEFGEGGNVVESPTFKLFADNFVARNIIFKNTYNNDLIKLDDNGKKTTWAPAAFIGGDKASFHNCGFIGVQDTLSDAIGRHYFYNCTVVGAIDFIFSNGQSIYEKCLIKSISDRRGLPGYITAQGRNDPKDTSGFVFKDCHVSGTGHTLLGRPYRPYARVLFVSTFMENVISPEGWTSAWHAGSENKITFSEVNCTGPGADVSRRVSWTKKLTDEQVAFLTNTASFLDQDGCNMSTRLALLLVFLSAVNAQPDVSRTILVDKRGGGNFTTLKQAIDSIPSNNLLWTRIFLNHGVYVEKIVIPKDKPYIILQGDLKYPSVVEYGDGGNVVESPTFKLEADNFVARNIVFKSRFSVSNSMSTPKG
ncbi:unnamed protein product [Prunus armeniaca]|uniref:pectinesterase n=1 Tax=Prunus armeniaca TaxID=36596 RepID=A0A6J5V738_PRUAR|nr:unnamed protein product [Prunus armeniaca]